MKTVLNASEFSVTSMFRLCMQNMANTTFSNRLIARLEATRNKIQFQFNFGIKFKEKYPVTKTFPKCQFLLKNEFKILANETSQRHVKCLSNRRHFAH